MKTTTNSQITFEDVHAYLCSYPQPLRISRQLAALRAAERDAAHSAWTTDKLTNGYSLGDDGEVDLFSVFE